MKKSGQIVLFRFPRTNLSNGKLRPALLLGKVPGPFDDWLICMISSQIHQYVADFDDIVREGDSDFSQSGLKVTSVIRVGRLAVVDGQLLVGAIGEISEERLRRIKQRLSEWIMNA